MKRMGAKWNSFKMKVIKARLRNDWGLKKNELMKQLDLLIEEEYHAFNEFMEVKEFSIKKR